MSEYILTLIRGDKSIVISGKRPFLLQGVTGLSGLSATARTYSSSNIHGEVYKDSKFNPREISIKLEILAGNYAALDTYKDLLFRICNPDDGVFTLKIQKGNLTVLVDVVSDDVPEMSSESLSKTSSGTLTLLAHQPLFRSENAISDNLNEWTGGWTLPWSFPISFATRGANTKNIYNSGQIETPLIIQMYGPATNPKIENKTTGQYIQVNKAILAGELLTINTETGNSSVELTKTNGTIESAFNYIDILSLPFFKLQKGDNVLSYSNDEESSNDIIVTYNYLFLGI